MTAPITIRPAQERDTDDILELLNPIIRDTTITFTSDQKTAELINSDRQAHEAANWPYLVAEADGSVVGMASYAPFRPGNGYAHTMEHSIYRDPAATGLGIGAALLDALEDHARAHGVSTLIAGVSAENHAGIAFHHRHGFSHTATLPGIGRKFGRSLDLVIMHKSL